MSYLDVIQADQRLLILQVLQQDADYSHNEHVLKRALGAFGHNISSDAVRTQLGWLEEQQLLSINRELGVWVIKLRNRGEDVALGRVQIHGVARPRPD